MSIAIEFGCSTVRSLRRESARLLARRVSTDYLPMKAEASRKRLLDRHQDEYAICGGELIVLGTAAEDLAELLSVPMQSTFHEGNLRANDPVSRQFLAALVEGLLPAPQSSQQTCMVITSLEEDSERLQDAHDLEFLTNLVKLRGYNTQIISPALGLMFSACSPFGYSGLAISMGAEHTDVSIVHQTHEVARFTLPRGSADLDREMARSGQSYLRLQDGREVLNVRPIRNWREGVLSLNAINTPQILELRNLYRDLIRQTLLRCREELTPQTLRQLPAKLPLVMGGGLAAFAGTEKLCQEVVREVELPLQIATVSKAHDIDFASLKGALILSEIQQADQNTPLAA